MKNEPTQLEKERGSYNIEIEMSKDISRRKQIFTTNVNDPAYLEPINSLHKDYSKTIIFFFMDVISIFKIGKRRIFNLY